MTERWWDNEEDQTSKEEVEDLLNEAEAKRLLREEELAEAEHRKKMAEFTDPVPGTFRESESGDGPPVEYIGQRIVLKQDNNGCFYVKGRIGNLGNINFLVDTGASHCSIDERTAQMLGLEKGEQIETQTAAGPGIGYRTTLPDVTVGQMSIKNVDALINPLKDDDTPCILGMTFLGDIEWMHQNGMLILNPDGESDGTEVYGSNHWLWEDPGYAILAIILSLGIIASLFGAVVMTDGADEWSPIDSEIVAKYPGFDWVEYADCYTDEWGDEYCEYWYELDCWADLDVSYVVDNLSYTSGIDRYHLAMYGDYAGAEDECLEYGENGTMPIGSSLMIYYNINDPNDIGLDIPLSGAFGLFCCGIIQIILLILVLLGARYDVGSGNSASLTLGNSSFGPVGHHGHYGYYGQPHYYDRPWYRRPWFHRRRRVIRHRRESRTVSSFGGRKDSRRSGGGPSGGSGGGRSGGGGRKGR